MKQLASESPSCWRAWSPGAQLWPNLSRFVIFVYLVSVLDLLCYTVPKYWCYTGYTGAMLGCALLFQDSRLDIMLAKSSASWNLMERKFLGISLWVVETIKSWRWFSCCCFVLLFFCPWLRLKIRGDRPGWAWGTLPNGISGQTRCQERTDIMEAWLASIRNVNSRSISSEVLKESKTRKAGVELWEETHFKRSSDSQLVESFASRWVVHHKIVAHLCIRCPVKAPMCAEGFLVHLLPEQDGGNQRQSGPLLGNEAWRHNDTMVWKVTILTTLPNTDLWL